MTTPKMKDADLPLRDRIEAAIERVKTGQGQMRVPVEATDPDVVLFDCLAELDAAREAVHYANGVADLAIAMKHRDAAEAREAKLREAAQNYMAQFGQALEAHGIPYTSAQATADHELRAALAEGEDTHD